MTDVSRAEPDGTVEPSIEVGPTGVQVDTTWSALRDYFAGQALQGFCASGLIGFDDADWENRRAKQAYRMADAMLKARESR